MSLPPLRPRFSAELPCPPDEAVDRVRRALAASEGRFTGAIAGQHADVNLPPAERRMWSPCLHLEFRDEEGGPVVHGLLAPQPAAWTCYALTLLSAITVACFAACFALVQWMLERPAAFSLAVMTGAILLSVVLYRLSQMGQEATRPEMRRLRDFAFEAIGIAGAGAHAAAAAADGPGTEADDRAARSPSPAAAAVDAAVAAPPADPVTTVVPGPAPGTPRESA